MFNTKMIENEKDFNCKNKHYQPILLVDLNPNLDKKQRFLCNVCMEDLESEVKTIGLIKMIQIISDKQESKQRNLTNITDYKNVAQDWSDDLLVQRKSSCEYSFYDELDNFIKNFNIDDASIKLINNINRSWMTKLLNNLHSNNEDKDKLKFNELKQQFTNIINKKYFQEDEIQLKLIDQSVKQIYQCNAIVFDSI
ncbi:unnamed protein product [Paramecium sonneborni]|uniref:Uncharacterized protein n=1 Tax=Paramecium sonneborni TaxID=65129 RepID=A0A8S1RG59_9CILI|nr:unnamed protein product [Paramecium sonneborni]